MNNKERIFTTSTERIIVQKLFESKGLCESSFEVGGSTYKCVFGKYYKDGNPITREDYFAAKEKESSSSSTKASNEDNTKGIPEVLKSAPGTILEDDVENLAGEFDREGTISAMKQISKILGASSLKDTFRVDDELTSNEYREIVSKIDEDSEEEISIPGIDGSAWKATIEGTPVIITNEWGYQNIYWSTPRN